jgi:hypothetical protein
MGEGGDPHTKNKKGKFLFQFLKRCFHSLIIGYFQNKSRTKRGLQGKYVRVGWRTPHVFI